MDTSFYTAARAARTHQSKLDVISNNIANVNTNGYKSQTAVFMDLMYYNQHERAGVRTDKTAGTGVRIQHTNTNFDPSGLTAAAEGGYNYAIEGEGFFMVQNQTTNEITYTRLGAFHASQRADGFYLVTDSNKLVLDQNRNPIRITGGELSGRLGVFTFANTNGMESVGDCEYRPVAKNGAPTLLPNARVMENYVETSNVDMAQQMADTIESSRAYSYALKMVQTSDEIEQTINGLRN